MRAVKGSLGYSHNERYREPENAQWEIHQALFVWPILHSSRGREIQGYAITPLRLIEMLDCKTGSSLLLHNIATAIVPLLPNDQVERQAPRVRSPVVAHLSARMRC